MSPISRSRHPLPDHVTHYQITPHTPRSHHILPPTPRSRHTLPDHTTYSHPLPDHATRFQITPHTPAHSKTTPPTPRSRHLLPDHATHSHSTPHTPRSCHVLLFSFLFKRELELILKVCLSVSHSHRRHLGDRNSLEKCISGVSVCPQVMTRSGYFSGELTLNICVNVHNLYSVETNSLEVYVSHIHSRYSVEINSV